MNKCLCFLLLLLCADAAVPKPGWVMYKNTYIPGPGVYPPHMQFDGTQPSTMGERLRSPGYYRNADGSPSSGTFLLPDGMRIIFTAVGQDVHVTHEYPKQRDP